MNEDWQRDADLLRRWRAGDERAGDELYARHGDSVIRFFRTKFPDEVEDLVQQTFLRLAEGRDRIRADLALKAYIFGIARNVLREHLRKLKRHRQIESETCSVVELAPGPSTIAARRREHKLVIEGLRRLPVQDQITLELYYWEGLSAKQIAAIEGVPHSTILSRLKRARDRLIETIKTLDASAALIASTVSGLEKWAKEVRQYLAE